MIKQIDCDKVDSLSINWIDTENKMVGWDDNTECCEVFGFVFSDKLLGENENYTINNKLAMHKNLNITPEKDLVNAVFSKQQPLMEKGIFKIEGSPKIKYLILFNFQNGWYSHGFDYTCDGKKIYEGSL